MKHPRPISGWFLSLLAPLLMTAVAGPAGGELPSLSDPRFLPGDRAIESPVGTQDFARIAAGGGGYLVVWEDERPVLNGFSFTDQPLSGNGIDLYAARFDADGHLVGSGAIVISQLGRNQTKPQVAWNEAAQAWLVVWVTQRPDWYFFDDVVGARIAADGTLLDTTPIALRLENPSPANDYARNPTVASDGQNWIVAWEDQAWSGAIGRPNVSARRVAPGGGLIEASAVVLYQHPDDVFGPIMPHVAWAGDEYLLVWERAGYYDIYGRRIAANLAPLAPQFVITSTGLGPRVASNGTDFLIASRYARAHRVTHNGVSLDPAGIVLDVIPSSDYRGPDVAWNGTEWIVASASRRPFPDSQAIFLSRISPGGTLIAPSTALVPEPGDQMVPSVASAGGGISQVVWTERDFGAHRLEDIRGTRVDASGVAGTNDAISTGWPRQEHVRFATNGSEYLAVYLSQRSGASRVMAQRVSSLGVPIDAEATELGTAPESWKLYPDAAWNGSVYLVSWCYNGIVYARRLAPDGTVIDPAPVAIVNDTADNAGVGALGSNFLLAYTHTFSGDQRSLKGIVVRGSDLSIAGPATTIGGSFVELFPQVRVLGTRWLVVWVHRPTHDSPASSAYAAFVDASGVPAPAFVVSGPGYGFEADVAVGNGHAFVAYVDNATFTDSRIEGRLLNTDGTYIGGEFVICDAAKHQRYASCGWDGGKFVAAWTDFRMLGDVDQLRGDIYAARIGWTGVVQDPNGFPVTTGPLPEDLSAVAGTGGVSLVAYSALDGPRAAEVQRIGYRLLGTSGVTSVESPAVAGESGWRVGPNPFRETVSIDFVGARGAMRSSPSSFEVFGADGRRVWRRDVPPGAQHLTWDGRDETGQAAPAGVYFARVSSGSRVIFHRMVIKIN